MKGQKIRSSGAQLNLAWFYWGGSSTARGSALVKPSSFFNRFEIWPVFLAMSTSNVFFTEIGTFKNILMIKESQHLTTNPYVCSHICGKRSLVKTVALDQIGTMSLKKHVDIQFPYDMDQI